MLQGGHEEDRVDVGGKLPVVVGELQLSLEVGDRPEAAYDRGGTVRSDGVHGEAVEGRDVGPAGRHACVVESLAQDADAGGSIEERRLPWIPEDRDHDAVEHGQGAPDDIEMAIGDRIERPGVDRDLHASSSTDPAGRWLDPDGR